MANDIRSDAGNAAESISLSQPTSVNRTLRPHPGQATQVTDGEQELHTVGCFLCRGRGYAVDDRRVHIDCEACNGTGRVRIRNVIPAAAAALALSAPPGAVVPPPASLDGVPRRRRRRREALTLVQQGARLDAARNLRTAVNNAAASARIDISDEVHVLELQAFTQPWCRLTSEGEVKHLRTNAIALAMVRARVLAFFGAFLALLLAACGSEAPELPDATPCIGAAVRVFECKLICASDLARCPGSTGAACFDECVAFASGTRYCPEGGL